MMVIMRALDMTQCYCMSLYKGANYLPRHGLI